MSILILSDEDVEVSQNNGIVILQEEQQLCSYSPD